jgi:4-amino-4-deoxy-L-arabinose transferase-like glycosyltransferase
MIKNFPFKISIPIKISLKKTQIILFLLWFVATLFNLDKAFHIDDTFHLEAAQWIEKNPLSPMSGMVNWGDNYESLYHFNQPVLYFYLIALVGKLFGYNEICLHIFQSFFTLVAIVFFYKIAAVYYPKFPLLLTSFLVLCPAFLVNQNLMIDIPILSLSIVFFYILLRPTFNSEFSRYLLAAIILSILVLLKYTILPLLIILPIIMFIRKQYKLLYLSTIPVLIIILWSLFNYLEVGTIHIANRVDSTTYWDLPSRFKAFLINLGATTPFTVAFFSGYFHKYKLTRMIILSVILIIFSYIALFYKGVIAENEVMSFLKVFSFLNGSLFLGLMIIRCKKIRNILLNNNGHILILLLWLTSIGLFIILFAPFMATRHVLLIIPAIILINAKFIENVSKRMRVLACFLTGFLGLSLSISDWNYADYYRKMPFEIKRSLPDNAKIWTAGHWGWQWYSKKSGMQQYLPYYSKIKKGDYFVIPQSIDQQSLQYGLKLLKIDEFAPEFKIYNSFSTAGFADFYCAEMPWFITKRPFAPIYLYKVEEIIVF